MVAPLKIMKLCAAPKPISYPPPCPTSSALTIDSSEPALARDIVDGVLQPAQVRLVERPRQPTRRRRTHALHEERHAERVKALSDEEVDRARCRPSVLRAQRPREHRVPELGPGLVHAEELELRACAGADGRRGGRRSRRRRRAAGLALRVDYGRRVRTWLDQERGTQEGGDVQVLTATQVAPESQTVEPP